MPFPLSYWKYIAVVLLVTGAYVEGSNRTANHYKTIIAERDAAEAKATLNKFTSDVNNIATAARQFNESAKVIEDTAAKLERTRRAYAIKNPLPDNCKPDDERVRNLKSTIDAANSTIGQ